MGYSLGSNGQDKQEEEDLGYQNVVGQDDFSRFDKKKKQRPQRDNRPSSDGRRPRDNRNRTNRENPNNAPIDKNNNTANG